MNIVFMGTPEFAVPCLQAVLDAGETVIAVYTQPDKPKGRGHKVLPPPVKELAIAHGIPVFQPKTLRDEQAQEEFRALHPDLAIVVAYGKILPKAVLDMPKLGCINVHGSLLPKYRGAGPIQWAILNGETETGVTTMYLAEGMDTGDMILKSATPIGKNETADELYDRLSVLGAELLLKTLRDIQDGSVTREAQEDSQSCPAPMLSKELCPIDFTKTAQAVHNQIRGLSSWPCAVTNLMGKRLKVYRSVIAPDQEGAAGELLDNKHFIVACGNRTAIRLSEVQIEGSKRLSGDDFLRGKPVETGVILQSL